MQARRFPWDEAGEVLAELLSAHLLELGPGSHQLRGEKIEVHDLPVPTTALMLRTYDQLCFGRVERRPNE
jgi:hypothetical protein